MVPCLYSLLEGRGGIAAAQSGAFLHTCCVVVRCAFCVSGMQSHVCTAGQLHAVDQGCQVTGLVQALRHCQVKPLADFGVQKRYYSCFARWQILI